MSLSAQALTQALHIFASSGLPLVDRQIDKFLSSTDQLVTAALANSKTLVAQLEEDPKTIHKNRELIKKSITQTAANDEALDQLAVAVLKTIGAQATSPRQQELLSQLPDRMAELAAARLEILMLAETQGLLGKL